MGALWLLLLAGCAATPQSRALLQAPPADIPSRVELTSVPFFPQEAYQCGPAALATILATQQINIQPDELVDRVYVPERQGSFQLEMIATARSFGLLTYPLAPQLHALLTELAAHHPILVFQNLGFDGYPIWHFAVIVGYDLPQNEIVLRSGTQARQTMSLSLFEQTWQRGGYWSYVIVAPPQLPATASPLTFTREMQKLIALQQGDIADQFYRAAIQQWPDSTLIWLGAGNSAYSLQHYEPAVTAFDHLIHLAPNDYEGWNNMAYALAQLGCASAEQAAQCAFTLAKGSGQVASTISDVNRILSQIRTHSAANCAIPVCPNSTQSIIPVAPKAGMSPHASDRKN